MSNVEKWQAEIDAKEELLVELGKLYRETYKSSKPWKERMREQHTIEEERKKIKGQITYRKSAIAKASGTIEHKDYFGQLIQVGSKVVHCSSSQYARVTTREVTKVNPKTIQLDGYANIDPNVLIVCDKLIASMQVPEEE